MEKNQKLHRNLELATSLPSGHKAAEVVLLFPNDF
jgi:hypothetical protein